VTRGSLRRRPALLVAFDQGARWLQESFGPGG